MKKISVIGAGAWGTTLANLIAENGHLVHLWAREKNIVTSINEKRENVTYLKNKTLSNNIIASVSLKEVVENSDFIITAVPSQFLRMVLKDMAPFINVKKPIIIDVAKGIENKTYKRMSEIIEEEITIDKSVVVLSGPNHSEEVSKRLPTATVVASMDHHCLNKVIDILSTSYFRVLPHDDVIGVEMCAALKNIAAIAIGISVGLGYGDNASASIMTLALMEMNKIGRIIGAKRTTFYGLAGVGDLIVTCTSIHSRNRFVGLKIAEGKNLDEIHILMQGKIAEGILTCRAIYELSNKLNITLPLTTEIYNVLFEKKDLKKAIHDVIHFTS